MRSSWHPAVITDSRFKNKKGIKSLELSILVTSGVYRGRRFTDRIVLVHKNPIVVEIGYRTLSMICIAVHLTSISNSAQLHNIPFLIRWKGTRIKGYMRNESLWTLAQRVKDRIIQTVVQL